MKWIKIMAVMAGIAAFNLPATSAQTQAAGEPRSADSDGPLPNASWK